MSLNLKMKVLSGHPCYLQCRRSNDNPVYGVTDLKSPFKYLYHGVQSGPKQSLHPSSLPLDGLMRQRSLVHVPPVAVIRPYNNLRGSDFTLQYLRRMST